MTDSDNIKCVECENSKSVQSCEYCKKLFCRRHLTIVIIGYDISKQYCIPCARLILGNR